MPGSCFFYRAFIDTLLRSLRRSLADFIPEGSSILEAACGTGTQSLILAGKAERVVGFDSNPKMAECASRRVHQSPGNLSFIEADARDLSFIYDDEYDFATISLALHEMNKKARLPVLRELSRTSRNLLIADYSSPLPSTLTGAFTRLIERLAGKEHYSGFCSYQSTGGLDILIHDSGLEIIREHLTLKGIVRILHCRGRSPVPG